MWTAHNSGCLTAQSGNAAGQSGSVCPFFAGRCIGLLLLSVIMSVTMLLIGWLASSSAEASFRPTMLDKAADDFNLAVGLYRGGRWQLAADTFAQFLQEFPEHPRSTIARLYYGLSLSSLEEYTAARPQFVEFIRLDGDSPQAADARYRLGESSYYLKDYAAAIKELDDYLTRHPQHSLVDWATLFLSDSHNGLGQWDQGEPRLRALLSKPPAPQILRDTQFALARSLEGKGETDEAVQLYGAIADDRQSVLAPRALAKMGTLHFNRQQYADAVRAYDQIVLRHPNSGLAASATLNSGLALFRLGELETALEKFRAVEPGTTNSAQAIFMAALSLKELGRIQEARQSFIDALEAGFDHPLAADILFQRGQLERADNQAGTAAQIFEDFADRWPQDRRVPECLFNAADLRLELADVVSAERLWQRLEQEYPEQSQLPREQILLGRLRLNQKRSGDAIPILRRAVSGVAPDVSQRVLAVGRYYLIRALFEDRQFADVIEEAGEIQELLNSDDFRDLRSALALAAISGLQVEDFAAVKGFADAFLPLADDQNQKADVQAARTVALTHLRDYAAALEDARQLAAIHAARSQTWSAVLQAADAATKLQAYGEAADFFSLAAEKATDREIREAGMTGVAWSYFRHRNYRDAEAGFVALARTFPDSADVAQAIYMQARCAEELDETQRAANSYQSVFNELTSKAGTAAAGEETASPLQYAYDAGRQAARMLGRLQQIPQADQQWEQLVARFPEARDLDRVLDEWAAMNLKAERYERSDQIHRQLLQRFPDSAFAGQARLSLAESDMLAERLDTALQEFERIVAEPAYGDLEKERALFHVIDINTSRRSWTSVQESAERFLSQYPESDLEPQVRLLAAESVLHTVSTGVDVAAAVDRLQTLRDEVLDARVAEDEWTERIWVVLAEAFMILKEYGRIDEVSDELTTRRPMSRFQFQLWDVQGRRWKNQAPPDFGKAREYFRRVISDPTGQGTETAASCQFLIGETLILEKDYEAAMKEYLRVYINYPYAVWQSQALYQAAGCEMQLGQNDAAIKSYRELISKFPESEYTARARERLKDLGSPLP